MGGRTYWTNDNKDKIDNTEPVIQVGVSPLETGWEEEVASATRSCGPSLEEEQDAACSLSEAVRLRGTATATSLGGEFGLGQAPFRGRAALPRVQVRIQGTGGALDVDQGAFG